MEEQMGGFGPTGLDSDTDVGSPRMLRWCLTRVEPVDQSNDQYM